MKKHIDLDSTTSHHTGIKGLFERALRNFKTLSHVLTMIPIYMLGALIFGTGMVPSIFMFRWVSEMTATSAPWVQNFGTGISLAGGFFLYGFTMCFLVPAMNWAMRVNLEPWRGPYYSAESLKWFLHNALTYMLRFTFLEFITPSPLNILFYQMMGMKIGRGSVLNTSWISDPSLIEIGEKTTLGGSVTVCGHYGQGGLLILAPVKIGSNCTIGIKSTIMGGVTIGDNAKIMPHSVLLPKTVVPAGETWGGVPAIFIAAAKVEESKSA